ncbi:MAG: hypothetical protein D8M59_09670 [Planctomycetes bacterium]|nr:hypothetical protein [Planctomycetota bacterium]NOG53473.1 hypothetical protein [Planctomycetota bacterium]
MDDFKPPIILIANARSGTTMTARCFACLDDQIVTWSELRMIWMTGDLRATHDRRTADMATPRIVRRIRRRFHAYQHAHGNRRIMEKTPSNCLRVPFVNAVFPESLFIHMVRDGRDVVSSTLPFWNRQRGMRRVRRRLYLTPFWQWPLFIPWFARDWMAPRFGLAPRIARWGLVYPGMEQDRQRLTLEELIAWQWVMAVETALKDFESIEPDRIVFWRYEDVADDPIAQYQTLLDRAGIRMTNRLTTHLEREVHADSVGAWRERLTPDIISRIMPIMRPTLARLGYALDD